MRVTNNMITNRVVYNVQQALGRYLQLETEMSSGKRINNPSDDPVGTLRDLSYRTELSKLGQYQKNVSQGQNWLNSYDGVLDDVNLLLSDAKDLALAMSNDTYDTSQRKAAATEIESIFDRIVQLSNSQIGGRQMFSGFRTKLEPFRVGGNGVTYLGDTGQVQFEISSGVRQPININATDVFLKATSVLGEKADLNVAVTRDTLLADLNGGDGVDLTAGTITITDENLVGVSAVIDMAAAPPITTVGEAIDRINAALTAAGMNASIATGVSSNGNSLSITTTPSGQISTDTKISRLREGQGIDLSRGNIRLTDGTGIDLSVDLSTAVTVGDIITTFNSAMASRGYPDVTMGINAAGDGLVINDATLPPLGLTVSNSSETDQTAAQLGIAGYVGAQLTGADLNAAASFTIGNTTGTSASGLGIVGNYTASAAGTDLDPLLTLTTNISDLRNGLGFDGDQFILWQGENSHTVDLSDSAMLTIQDLLDDINNSGLNVTAELNESGRGIQIVNNDPSRSFTIQDVDDGLVAKQMDIFGSSDMMGSLLVLADALRNDDQEGINLLLANLDDAMTLSVEMRSAVGNNALRLETTASQLADLELGFTELLSEEEDADLTKVVTELAMRENNYQAALSAAAKIIQPSLLNFLK
jgi:flagellar hook-associated protein 3